MAKEIVWRKKAQDRFKEIIAYLDEHWSVAVAEEFINRVEDRLRVLKKFPLLGVRSEKKNDLRMLVLSPQNRLIYILKEKKIIILTIEDTRQKSSEFL